MSFLRENQTRYFFVFIVSLILAFCLSGIFLYTNLNDAFKTALLHHDRAIASSLTASGISQTDTIKALTNTTITNDGLAVTSKAGLTESTETPFFTGISPFSHQLKTLIIPGVTLFSVLLLGGTCFFLSKREQIYKEALDTINDYVEGNYDKHLPNTSEGTLYRMFISAENLATALKAGKEKEHKAREFLKDTISDVSHQLKTPLAALSMYNEIILEESDDRTVVLEFSEKTTQSLERMGQLIQSLLKITRLDAGAVTFDKKPITIKELVSSSIKDLTTRSMKEDKTITINGGEDKISCDVHWTSEAISNLVKNALDHTKEGGIIDISWERTPAMLRLSVSDNGSGISPEDIHHIFKKFYRSKNSLDTQGVGLGLPLAKSIIEGQGGVISVTSTPDKGTVFHISFLTEL